MKGNVLNIIKLLEGIKTGELARNTGEGHLNNTPSFLDKLRFASKEESSKAAREASTASSNAKYGTMAYSYADYDTGNRADTVALNQRQMEYVPFAYTLSSNPNSPTQYGYIIRYANGDPGTIYGVTTETRDYNADGAKDFFERIKRGGGSAKLYNGSDNLSEINKSVRPVYGTIRWPVWAGGGVESVRVGSEENKDDNIRHRALKGSFDLIDAIRDMNHAGRIGRFGR